MVTIIPVKAFPGKKLLGFQDVVIRRSRVKEILHSELLDQKGKPRFKNEADTRVVYSSPLVDVAANMELVRETAEVCNLILTYTNWDIRLLSKSNLLPEVVKRIPEEFRCRLILGVSTGTLDDNLAKAFEKGTALPSKRIASLAKSRNMGTRTFGMICPSLPQDDYDAFSKAVCSAIDVNSCEEVWAEVINLRGKSFSNTINDLLAAGFADEANRLCKVCGSKSDASWEAYARATFEAHVRHVPKGKLRFLQYVTEETYEWWKTREKDGAVLLGAYVKALQSAKSISAPIPEKLQMELPLTGLSASTRNNGVAAESSLTLTLTVPEGKEVTVRETKLPSRQRQIAMLIHDKIGISRFNAADKNTEANGDRGQQTDLPRDKMTPGERAWRTMRERYTSEEIKLRQRAAGKKAAQTRRANRLIS
ncbi:hypothetical protein BH09VER1_BH09VER1_26410 [soil metagenome]